ncbi:MAG TPA: type II toxin-antitoxin system PemK/MazF family toxin [Tepidisphaeraceae bacterium]
MTIRQGDICWANLGEPTGSAPGYRRPVVVVQCDALNRSRLATVVCVPLSSQVAWADLPGNLLLLKKSTSLSKDSVANASQIITIDKSLLTEHVGHLSSKHFQLLLAGIDIVLGR